jgi:predicted RNA-binding Zn ribbon-like protein
MRYEDYIGNLARLAVELVNTASADGLTGIDADLLSEHGIIRPTAAELAPLLAQLRPAMAAVAAVAEVTEAAELDPVNRLLRRYPPRLHISEHDGLPHLHHAEDGEPAITWLGRSCAAALAHIACGVPEVTIGRCRAAGCPRFFVDQSRNHSRRFCGNTCASRTTVAAYRERRKETR